MLKVLRGYFLTGLLAVTPLAITLWILLRLLAANRRRREALQRAAKQRA